MQMATIWESKKKATPDNSFRRTILSSWSRQQKLAMTAGLVILAILLGMSACSKQSAKTASVRVSEPAPSATINGSGDTTPSKAVVTAVGSPPETPASAPARKTSKVRAANVTYRDPDSGVTFLYPRKFPLATGDKAQPDFESDIVAMNFVQKGGTTVATVTLPRSLYPGTDFASAFFSVNVNPTLSEEECSHFAFVDTRDADGEPIDAERVKVGSADMEMTSEFAGSATQQAEARYYHNYENGACYEYVLGLGTAGYGSTGIEPVNRDEVFARLEKILTSVKIEPARTQFAPEQQVAEQPVAAEDSGKE
jgi:hypothetical protein